MGNLCESSNTVEHAPQHFRTLWQDPKMLLCLFTPAPAFILSLDLFWVAWFVLWCRLSSNIFYRAVFWNVAGFLSSLLNRADYKVTKHWLKDVLMMADHSKKMIGWLNILQLTVENANPSNIWLVRGDRGVSWVFGRSTWWQAQISLTVSQLFLPPRSISVIKVLNIQHCATSHTI